MKLWSLFTLIFLISSAASPSQETGGTMQKGDDALDAGLWEVAELHYRENLTNPALSPEAKPHVALRLAETLIRAGNPTEALDLLAQSFVSKHPEAPFWKAHALAALHRYHEAAEIFTTLLASPAPPHRTETGLTLASLRLALGQPEAALQSLAKLRPISDPVAETQVQLTQVQILLDLGRTSDARAAMPGTDKLPSPPPPLAKLLEAQLLLAEAQPSLAEKSFRDLLDSPQGQTLTQHHTAALGLADALRAQGQQDAATESLLTFLENRPNSPLLEAFFKRILDSLPEKTTIADPTLERLAEWITASELPATGLISTAGPTAISAWPTYPKSLETSERTAFSLYVSAIILHRTATPAGIAESRRRLTRLRLEFPNHLLAQRALYQLARWSLENHSADQAFALLDTLRETSQSPTLKGEAAFLEARAAYASGDAKRAVQLFDEAARSLAAPEARSAKLQSAIAQLRSGGTTLIQNPNSPPDPQLAADLTLERALATTPPAAAKSALDDFLARFPNHPRIAEATLAAIEATLASPVPDLGIARAQLDSLPESPATPAPRIALAQLRLSELGNNTAATLTAAQSIIDRFPAEPAAAEAALTLGRTLFQTGSYNTARLTLEKLAASAPLAPQAQAAWLLAARSAALGGTPQSKDEALILFDKAIQSGGPLTPIATLEKASHLISLYRLAEASEFLAKWTKTLPENDPLQLPAGLLLGQALYAQGTSRPASLIEALAVYDKLLAQAKTHPALLNRLQYLRGTTLEQLPDEKDPTQKREKQAFQAFHSVLETTTPPTEWEFFEQCSFRALALLEKDQRWEAAILVAQKIASFKGPRAEEAATRASQLQLTHMIW